MTNRPPSVESWPVVVVGEDVRDEVTDAVVVEEPLEISVRDGEDGPAIPLTVTLRTPGADAELAAGLLYAEGVIARADDVLEIRPAAPAEGAPFSNRLEARLRRGLVRAEPWSRSGPPGVRSSEPATCSVASRTTSASIRRTFARQ